MQSVAIVAFCVAAAIGYGILHDQVTARICVEYFTIGHPPMFATNDPTLLALGWGIISTWWAGLMLGIPVACAARFGKFPKWTAGRLIRPIVNLLFLMAVLALFSGFVGWIAADRGYIVLLEPLSQIVPVGRHTVFIADLWAHTASYFVGFTGGIVVIAYVVRSRFVEWKNSSVT